MTPRVHFYLLTIFVCASLNYMSSQPAYDLVQQAAQLHLPKIPTHFHFYDKTTINFHNPQIYPQTIQRWQEKLRLGTTKLFNQLQQEINLSPAEIYEHTTNPQIIDHYHTTNANRYLKPNVIDQEHMDPEILFFLQTVLFQYTDKRNITFYLTDDISCITATYGSDAQGYHVLCDASVYNKKHIHDYYATLQSSNGFYYVAQCGDNDTKWIETSTLLKIGLIDATSRIQHQTGLIRFVLTDYKFNGKSASNESIKLYAKLESFRCLLEAVFQSYNPLETAVFLSKMQHDTPADKTLWKSIVKDIAQCYDANSLKTIKEFAQAIKQAATQQ